MRSITTRFVVILLVLGFVSSLLVGVVMYSQFRSYVDDAITLELERVSLFITSHTQLGDLSWVRREGRLSSSSFEELVESLYFFGEKFGLAYIYLLEERETHPFFIFDTDYYESGIDIGLPYETPPPELEEVFADQIPKLTSPYTDEFGTFVSLLTPINNISGEPGAVLGVDYNISAVQQKINRAIISLGLSVAGGTILALILSLLFGHRLSSPIKQIALATKELSQGDLKTAIALSKARQDEIGEMALAVESVRTSFADTISGINKRLRKINDLSIKFA